MLREREALKEYQGRLGMRDERHDDGPIDGSGVEYLWLAKSWSKS